jgi:hypothetical protein
MNLAEDLYSQLKHDQDTDTNRRLQKKVRYLNEIIEQQKARIESLKIHNMHQEQNYQATKNRLNQRNLEVTELRSTSSKLQKDLKSLTYKINTEASVRKPINQIEINHTNGLCVVCIDSSAIYAHPQCGCLTYCADCMKIVAEKKAIHAWNCPRCRTISDRLIRIYNLYIPDDD